MGCNRAPFLLTGIMAIEFEIGIGSPAPLGANIIGEYVNFAFYSENAEKIELCLFSKNGEKEIARIAMDNKSGNVFHCALKGVRDLSYAFRAFGPYSPHEGQWFNPQKLLLDPYSKKITEPFCLHKSMFDNDLDSADYMPKSLIVERPDFEPRASFISLEQSIIYELHLKGFSEKFPNIEETERGRWAALRNPHIVKYFKELGVNCLEIMPCAAWIDERHLRDLGLKNYWGYNPIGFMAPDPRYAPNGFEDVFKAVKTLESHGIETIIDIVFNHSGESDELGPIVSMRGLDNSVWYSLQSDKSKYQNPAGTGNILNANSEMVLEFMLETMRVWHLWGGVHGFRFDLGTVMARNKTGFDAKARFFDAINKDPILSKLKMIAEPWDCETYQLGQFPNNFGEWNDKFRDDMRKFWLKGSVSIGAFAHGFCGSQSVFGAVSPAKSINYVTAHDGFTLNDLVSYNSKHNEANGENNRDGSSENHSNNHGIEGTTFDSAIIANRKKAQKNLIASLLISRGVPMLCMGSELGNTQYGNNNSYCQDNELNYLDWENSDTEIFEFTKKLIAIRKEFACFSANKFFSGTASAFDGSKDIEWFNLWGAPPSQNEWSELENGFLGALIADNDCRLAFVINRTQDTIEFSLPQGANFDDAIVLFDTFDADINVNKIAPISTKLIRILSSEKSQNEVDFVCQTYGIDCEWWDVDGNCHQVPNSTKATIMEEFGFDINDKSGRIAALNHYSNNFETRVLPYVLTSDEGTGIKIPLAFGINNPTPIGEIEIFQNGAFISSLETTNAEITKAHDCMGNPFLKAEIPIPHLPMGRYELRFGNIQSCLLIAPKTAYSPEFLNNKCFGLSAQTYAFEGENAKDFGDFSVLSELLNAAQNWGAKALAVNPFHALFSVNREFKSPYYPSHRAFIDLLYFPLANVEVKKSEIIDYDSATKMREKALRSEFEHFEKSKEFENFCETQGKQLADFALFNALSIHFENCDSQNWPIGYQNPNSPKCASFAKSNAKEIEFQKFVQWRLHTELENASKGKSVALCRDLAIGAAPNGAEVWSNPDYYAKNTSIGAPPDPLGPLGQVWGLPPPKPMAILKDGLRTYFEILNANMQSAGALRIDHAMGIMRQFWVPNNAQGRDGAYVKMPFKELWAAIKIASWQNKCLIIAEDLGTVPHGFSEKMNEANALSYKILLFEKSADKFYPISSLKRDAFACASTHDLPPIKAWWNATDLQERLAISLINKNEFEIAIADREKDKTQLLQLIESELGLEVQDFGAELVAAIHELLSRSDAKLIIAQFEDLAQAERILNLPGTNLERPNWQYKVKKSVKEISKSDFAQKIIAAMAKTGQ